MNKNPKKKNFFNLKGMENEKISQEIQKKETKNVKNNKTIRKKMRNEVKMIRFLYVIFRSRLIKRTLMIFHWRTNLLKN